jgi:hypothetical protein
MAVKLAAGTAQLRLLTLNPQGPQQLGTGLLGEVVQVTPQSRRALVVCNISNRRPRGNHAKPLAKRGQLAQKSLQGRLS